MARVIRVHNYSVFNGCGCYGACLPTFITIRLKNIVLKMDVYNANIIDESVVVMYAYKDRGETLSRYKIL